MNLRTIGLRVLKVLLVGYLGQVFKGFRVLIITLPFLVLLDRRFMVSFITLVV